MTSQTIVPRALYAANGVQTAFGFTFPVFEAGDMEVWIDQTLQPGSAYTISGVGVAVGGTVIFTVPPPASSQVTLRRRMPLNRLPEFPDTSVQAKPLNEEFTYHTAALQQLADETSLAVKRSFRSLSTADLTLPEPVAGKAICWNDAGNGLVNSTGDMDGILAQSEAYALACAADADATAADRTASGVSAAAAAASATAASASETTAGVAAAQAITAKDLAEGYAAAADVAKIQWQGAWSAMTAYALNDAVSHGGSSWICIQAHTNQTPAAGAYWDPLAAKGTDGLGAGDMLAANNLSDLASPATARSNLGLAAVATSGAYTDLSGRPSLGTAAAANTGTANGNVPAMDAVGYPAANGSQITHLNGGNIASGTVPTARLGSGTANSGTFLRGDGIWAVPGGGGGYAHVSSAVPSGTAVTFTGLLAGYDYILVFENLITTGSGTSAYITVQVGVGGAYRTSGYVAASIRVGNAQNIWTNGFVAEDGRDDGTSGGLLGTVEIINPNNSATKTQMFGFGYVRYNGSNWTCGGRYDTAEANDCIRVVGQGGNALSGTMITLFSRKRS